MRTGHIDLMGSDFTSRLPTLMQDSFVAQDLLLRVLVEIPEIRKTQLGGDILAAVLPFDRRLALRP